MNPCKWMIIGMKLLDKKYWELSSQNDVSFWITCNHFYEYSIIVKYFFLTKRKWRNFLPIIKYSEWIDTKNWGSIIHFVSNQRFINAWNIFPELSTPSAIRYIYRRETLDYSWILQQLHLTYFLSGSSNYEWTINVI